MRGIKRKEKNSKELELTGQNQITSLSIETRLKKVKTIDKISNKKGYVPDKARVKQKNSLIPMILIFNAALFVSNAILMQLWLL